MLPSKAEQISHIRVNPFFLLKEDDENQHDRGDVTLSHQKGGEDDHGSNEAPTSSPIFSHD